jgi:hypothetical protein
MAAVVANLSLVVAYCKRQAEQTGISSAEAAAAAKTGLPGALLGAWTRIFVRPRASARVTGTVGTSPSKGTHKLLRLEQTTLRMGV